MNDTIHPEDRSGIRLAKRVAELRSCSRREAEQYIEGGWVRVDGQVVEEPQFRVLDQKIEFDPNASLLALTPVTLLLHKPPGHDAMAEMEAVAQHVKPALHLINTATHAPDDASGIRVLKRHFAKLTALTPLETAASGLVVFTQDWRVARKLTEDATLIEQEFIVEVAGEVLPDHLQRLRQMQAEGRQPLPAFKASLNSAGPASSKLRFAIKGIHPGLVAWLCERTGLRILGMKRLRIGRVSMGPLLPGQWRYLMAHERF